MHSTGEYSKTGQTGQDNTGHNMTEGRIGQHKEAQARRGEERTGQSSRGEDGT